jgi:hypothetical protein
MKRTTILCLAVFGVTKLMAQTNPAITSWLLNTNGALGRHYMQGNSTPIQDNDSVNCQAVLYSNQWVYVKTKGIPAYVTGPFLDGNPSVATNQNAIFKLPLNPTVNSGNPTPTNGGNIGVFINGVALFDYRDGVSWNNMTQAEGGGPIQGPPGQGIWNRDAIVAERAGFDCAKGHPAMGNYHHHQNPSAFDLDLQVISTVCNLYDADGLYVIDSTQHSPIIGYAYDGFPIYGAYGYSGANGSGPITRMKSSYQLRNITVRTHYADGTDVADGPAVSTTYPLGRYREDYEFISHPNQPDYLDEHNGRFCITPEYPNGIYAYFCTVDENWNSAYPYAVGPTFYGNKVAAKVQVISEAVSEYNGQGSADVEEVHSSWDVVIFPNPSHDFVAVQYQGLLREDANFSLVDAQGRVVQTSTVVKGSTIAYLDVRTIHTGMYTLQCLCGDHPWSKVLTIEH